MIFLIESKLYSPLRTNWIINTMQIKFSHKGFKENILEQNKLGIL